MNERRLLGNERVRFVHQPDNSNAMAHVVLSGWLLCVWLPRYSKTRFQTFQIDVSHNCGRSKIGFLAFFRLKTPLFDRKSPIRKWRFCRISHFYRGLRRASRLHISRNYWLFRDRMRPKIDRMRLFYVICAHFYVISRHFCVTPCTTRIPTYVESPQIF